MVHSRRILVFSIAKAIWRKRRAQLFLEVQLMIDVQNRFFDETIGFRAFAALLNEKPERAFEEQSRYLRADKIDYLKTKVPSRGRSSSRNGVAVN